MDPQLTEAYLDRGSTYGEIEDFDKALNDFTKLIRLSPHDGEAYRLRGIIHAQKGDFRHAINDFTTMIEVNPENGNAYYYRGDLWLHLQEWEQAKSDLTTAQNMGIDIIALFHNHYASVEDFEQKIGVQLPEDIAILLTPPQA